MSRPVLDDDQLRANLERRGAVELAASERAAVSEAIHAATSGARQARPGWHFPRLATAAVTTGVLVVAGALAISTLPAGPAATPRPSDPSTAQTPTPTRSDANGVMTWTEFEAVRHSVPDGTVVTLTGWLVGGGPPIPCPSTLESAAPGPTPPAGTRFTNGCQFPSWLTPTEFQPTVRVEGGFTSVEPDVGIALDWQAYSNLATDPQFDEDGLQVPRYGTYRLVAVDWPGCTAGGCDTTAWRLSGRVDDPSLHTPPNVWEPTELGHTLSADRADWIGKVVLVNGTITDTTTCVSGPEGSQCAFGRLDGTDESVVLTGRSVPGEGTRFEGVLALLVRRIDLEYLGFQGLDDLEVDVATLTGPDALSHAALTTAVVDGWLVSIGPIECPMPRADRVSPPEVAGDCFDGSYLTSDPFKGPFGDAPAGVHLQPTAYQEFAPDPSPTDIRQWATEPRYGRYVVRLIRWADPSCEGTACRAAWSMIGRLDPADPAPSPGPSPSPTPAAVTEPLTRAALIQAVSGGTLIGSVVVARIGPLDPLPNHVVYDCQICPIGKVEDIFINHDVSTPLLGDPDTDLLALRIVSARSAQLLGRVVESSPGELTWPINDARDERTVLPIDSHIVVEPRSWSI